VIILINQSMVKLSLKIFVVSSLQLSLVFGQIQELEEKQIISLPLPRGSEDYAQPATSLSTEDLRFSLEASLGETLDGLPGVSSTNYFPGASRPIIRGFSNDRIRILSNGVDGIDASVGSLDHALTVEPYLAERVEIIRGPAVLLYGSNAVGGVVNVIDNRVPGNLPVAPLRTELHLSGDSASRGGVGHFKTQGREGALAFQVSGLFRQNGNLRIPGFGASDPELQVDDERGVLLNSFVHTREASVGLSRLWDDSFAGGALSFFRARYGLGRELGQEIEEINPDGSFDIEAELDDPVWIEMEQWRLDFRGGLTSRVEFIEEINWRLGIASYEHSEIEDGDIGTTFKNDGFELRTEFVHRPVGDWNGAFGFQLSRSDFEATGGEAFLRPTTTTRLGLFLFEELDLSPFTLQGGLRLEHQRTSPEFFERDEIVGNTELPDSFSKFGLSGATGLIWRPSAAHRLSFNYSYTQRLPSAQELYADGPHVGTFAYELSDSLEGDQFGREISHGVELSHRFRTGSFEFTTNLFYNRFQNFINLRRTGEFAFENEDETFTIINSSLIDQAFLDGRVAAGEENEFIAVTRYQRSGAEFYGLEVEARWNFWNEGSRGLDLTLVTDLVRAKDTDSGDPLPRIPPARFGGDLQYSSASWVATLGARHNLRQSRTAPFETETGGYTLVNFGTAYRLPTREDRGELILFGRIDNIFDVEARNHTSFVKDLAPLGGRNIRLGVEWAW
jgi:iron complex outermembrane receptor protein